MTSLERAQAAERAILAAELSFQLARVKDGPAATNVSQPLVRDGLKLLSSVVGGAVFIEQPVETRGAAPADATEAVRSYSEAVNAARLLTHGRSGDYAPVFSELRSTLEQVAAGRKPDAQGLQRLADFFERLSEVFYSRLTAAEPRQTQKTHDVAIA